MSRESGDGGRGRVSYRRRVVVTAILALLALLCAGGYVGRHRLLEAWWIHRLAASDAEARAHAATSLGKNGTDRAARALVEALLEGKVADEAALSGLEPIFKRARAETRVWVVERILAATQKGSPDGRAPGSSPVRWLQDLEVSQWVSEPPFAASRVVGFLAAVAPSAPETFPAFLAEIEKGSPVQLTQLAAVVLARAWPSSRGPVETFLARAPAAKAERFLDALEKVHLRNTSLGPLDHAQPLPEGDVLEIIRSLAREHAEPRVRALALSKGLIAWGSDGGSHHDLRFLAERFEKDPHPLVREAAARLAGAWGELPEGLDLKALLLSEKDPRLLATVIQARTLWAFRREFGEIELADGLLSGCNAPATEREDKPSPFSEEEVRRLRDLLREAADPSVRDAASMALAAHLKWPPPSESAPAVAAEAPALRVHEWGVWAEGETALAPSRALLDELPAFVHRSTLSVDDLLGPPGDVPDIIQSFKPVLFFHSPEPLTALVRVWFLGGRPWTFYPEATDYLEAPSGGRGRDAPSVFLNPQAAELEALELSEEASRLDGPGLAPPWIKDKQVEGGESRSKVGAPFRPSSNRRLVRASPRGELRSRYELVPWLHPNHSTSVDSNELQGLGLEWCGLRVGYGEEVEGAMAPAPPDRGSGSWWERLREVPSTPVALRGNHERFLYYDGPVRFPAPVLVRWADASRRALRLRTRDFLVLPRFEAWGNLSIDGAMVRPSDAAHLPGAFVVLKEAGKPVRGRLLQNLPSRSEPHTVPLEGLDLEGEALLRAFQDLLARQGLAPEEARSLVETWERELFAAEGLRVLTVLPRWLYDAALPIDIRPRPGELVRVGVVWKECGRLEVEKPSAERRPDLFGAPEPLELTRARFEIQRTPLEFGPEVPFDIEASGRLAGISPGGNTMVMSSDGKRIVHPRDGLTGWELHVADLEARRFTRVLRLPVELYLEWYTVSFDGQRVGVIVRENHSASRLLVADLAEQVLLEVVGPWKAVTRSSLTRDGRRLAFREGEDVVIVDLDSGEALRPRFPPRSHASHPVLSDDGKKLSLVLETLLPPKNGQSEGSVQLKEAAIVDLEARTLTRIARIAGSSHAVVLSEDNRRALFASQEGNANLLYLADLAAGRLVRLVEHEPSSDLRLFVSGGRKVIYLHRNAVWTIDLETGASRRLHEPRGMTLREGSASDDGLRLFYRAAHPRTRRNMGVYVVPLEAGSR